MLKDLLSKNTIIPEQQEQLAKIKRDLLLCEGFALPFTLEDAEAINHVATELNNEPQVVKEDNFVSYLEQ